MTFDINDPQCPVCHSPKKLVVKRCENHPESGEIEHFRIEFWAYAPSGDEVIVEAFCPECGIKFVTNDFY